MLLGGREDGRCLTKMIQQLSDADRSDMFDHIEGHQGFPRVHIQRRSDFGKTRQTESLSSFRTQGVPALYGDSELLSGRKLGKRCSQHEHEYPNTDELWPKLVIIPVLK